MEEHKFWARKRTIGKYFAKATKHIKNGPTRKRTLCARTEGRRPDYAQRTGEGERPGGRITEFPPIPAQTAKSPHLVSKGTNNRLNVRAIATMLRMEKTNERKERLLQKAKQTDKRHDRYSQHGKKSCFNVNTTKFYKNHFSCPALMIIITARHKNTIFQTSVYRMIANFV